MSGPSFKQRFGKGKKRKIDDDGGGGGEEVPSLPVHSVRAELVAELRKHSVLIVVGETGSGKTTQIPQFIVDDGVMPRGMVVAVTQPRRVAAVSVATRVASERKVKLGEEVGYTIRFDDHTSPNTTIKYMTDGMLLREATANPQLPRYGCIVIDEAHERSVATDIILALAKQLAQQRGKDEGQQRSHNGRPLAPLKLVVMSATLDVGMFSKYFGGAQVVFLEGRQFPVQILYAPQPEPDYQDAAVIAAMQVHLEQPLGDVLVFLTGQEEIEGVAKMLRERAKHLPKGAAPLLVEPMYAALPHHLQMKVFEPTPPNHRKIVLATNIAETSITIPGIRYVIDAGVVKARTHITSALADALVVVPISQDAARQRAGRAGRVSAGKCFRLFTEESFEKLAQHTTPEIARCNIASVVLQLKLYGVGNVLEFDFIQPPEPDQMESALMSLYMLRALDKDQQLTPKGEKMAALPVDPPLATVLLAAHELGCLRDVIKVVALLSAENLYFIPSERREEADLGRRAFAHADGDITTLLQLWRQWNSAHNKPLWCRTHFVNSRALARAADIRKQLSEICTRHGMAQESELDHEFDSVAVRKSMCAGLFANVAIFDPAAGAYVTVLGKRKVAVHPASVLHLRKPQCVLYCSLVFTSRLYMRDVSVIDADWLREVAPLLFAD